MDLLEIDADRITDLITGDAHGFTQHRATEAQHRHLGCATANVDDHRADGFRHRKARTNGGCHWFIDEMHFPCTGHARFAHGATLNAGHTTGDADDQTRRHNPTSFIAFGDEGLEHLLSCIEVGDHPIPQRPHGTNIPGGPAQHQLRLITNCKWCPALDIQRNNGRLLQDDAFA